MSKSSGEIDHGAIIQQAYVVNDVVAAAEKWHRVFGIGPFVHLSHISLPNAYYRGEPVEIELSAALAQAGDIQIELLQQHSDGPSCYRDAFAPGEEGFHHVAVLCRDFEAERARYEALGCATAMIFGNAEKPTCYMDARQLTGGMVELYTDHAGIHDIYRLVAQQALTWDGRDLLVPLPASWG